MGRRRATADPGVPHSKAADSLARLDEVGLHARATHRAGELSYAEQQRVVLGRALVGEPPCSWLTSLPVISTSGPVK